MEYTEQGKDEEEKMIRSYLWPYRDTLQDNTGSPTASTMNDGRHSIFTTLGGRPGPMEESQNGGHGLLNLALPFTTF